MTERVDHPAHYQVGGVEVIDLVDGMSFCRGNAVKYLARAGLKPGADEIEDLEKAAWYVHREIARLRQVGGGPADGPSQVEERFVLVVGSAAGVSRRLIEEAVAEHVAGVTAVSCDRAPEPAQTGWNVDDRAVWASSVRQGGGEPVPDPPTGQPIDKET